MTMTDRVWRWGLDLFATVGGPDWVLDLQLGLQAVALVAVVGALILAAAAVAKGR